MKSFLGFALGFLALPAFLRASPGADSTRAALLLGARLHAGFVIIHTVDLGSLRHTYPTALELDLAWHKSSQQAWESCLCYTKIGIAAAFWNFDDPVLGYGLTGMAYIEPVFGAWKPLSFSLRAAFGLSYQSNPYDAEDNPKNISYSTPVAFPLQLGVNAHLRLSPRWLLDLTAVYNHISNGGIREPNAGINWPSAALGVTRYLRPAAFVHRGRPDWRAGGRAARRLDVAWFMAFHEPESKLFLFSPGLELKFSRQVGRVSALTAGVEWMYDNGTRFRLDRLGQRENPQRASLALGHEFLLGRFLFSQQFGLYLRNPGGLVPAAYQRYGLVYRIDSHLQAGVNLKAHGHVANFLDFRLGWAW